jgi:hypothetical protein
MPFLEKNLKTKLTTSVPLAFSIGHGVIKPLALIPLQTCSSIGHGVIKPMQLFPCNLHVAQAYSRNQQLKKIKLLAWRTYSSTYPYTNHLYLLLSEIMLPMKPCQKLIYSHHDRS